MIGNDYKVIAVFPIESTICTTVELSEPLPQKGEAVVGVFPESWHMNPICPNYAERIVYRMVIKEKYGEQNNRNRFR